MQRRVAQRGGEMAFGKQQGRRRGDAEALCVLVVSFLINLGSGRARQSAAGPGRARQIAATATPPAAISLASRINTLNPAELKDSGSVCVCGRRARLSPRQPSAGRWGGLAARSAVCFPICAVLSGLQGRPGRGT